MKKWLGLLFICIAFFVSACVSEPQLEKEDLNDASNFNAQMGLEYMKQGRYDVALGKLKKAVEQNPDNAVAQHYIAVLYQQLGEFDKAESHYSQALDLTPNNSDLLNNYGVFLCNDKKYQDAYRYFDKVLKDPLYKAKGAVYENVGLCAQAQGDISKAEENLNFALRLNPESPKSMLAMAQISFDKQQYSAARKYYYGYLENARQTPESLWLGILLESRSGNKNRVASYKVLLKGKYPDSKEAALLKKMEASGKI